MRLSRIENRCVDPARVPGDVVDAIGYGLAEFGIGEVVHLHRLGAAFRAQLAPAVLEVADVLFLLGVDRDHRLTGCLERLHLGVDVLELGVAVRVVGALARLGIGLQAEVQALQQATDQLLTGGETTLGQRRRQMPLAPAHPQQGRLRIAADRRLHQVLQGVQKPRLRLGCWLAAATRSPNPRAEHHGTRTQVCQAPIDRAARYAGRLRYRAHPATSGRTCFTGREQPPRSLVQDRLKRLEASLDGSDVNHTVRIDAPASTSRQFPDSFVAFLSASRFFPSDSIVRGGSGQIRRHVRLAMSVHRCEPRSHAVGKQPATRVHGSGLTAPYRLRREALEVNR